MISHTITAHTKRGEKIVMICKRKDRMCKRNEKTFFLLWQKKRSRNGHSMYYVVRPLVNYIRTLSLS
jgi:hypothetical protein